MSRALSELLGATEPMFTNMLRKFEAESGHPGVDIRIVSEISDKVRQKTRELGLDPADTNGRELYHGLQSLVKTHDEFLAKAVGGDVNEPGNALAGKIIQHATSLKIPKNTWAIKHSSAKKLLKASPPKRVMKILGYRSLDSLLKREKMEDIYALIRVIESGSWQSKFINNYKQLSATDFETKKVVIVNFGADKFKKLHIALSNAPSQNIFLVKELGVVAVMPVSSSKAAGLSITLLPLLIHFINEARIYGAYFKIHQVKPNFSALVVDSILNEQAKVVTIAGQPLHWRTIQLRWGKHGTKENQSNFEPYLQSDDVVWKGSEDILYKLEPALKFWENLDYVAKFDDKKPVPLGLLDNAISFYNSLEYGDHYSDHFRGSLYNELYARYLGQHAFEQQVINQLDSSADVPDMMLAEIEGLF